MNPGIFKYVHPAPENPKNIVIVHYPCNDGFASAWAASCALVLDETAFIGHTYADGRIKAEDFEYFRDKTVYICDYSLPIDNMIELSQYASSITVLDHHKTFKEAIALYLAQSGRADVPTLGDAFTVDLTDKIKVVFDTNRSGAQITWDYFTPDGFTRPALINYVGYRDLWLKDMLTGIDEVHALLGTFPTSFEAWSAFNQQLQDDPNSTIQAGKAVLAMQHAQVAKLLNSAFWGTIAGYLVPIVNTAMHGSEVGNELCNRFGEAPFAATYFDKRSSIDDKQEVIRIWSLRGRKSDDFDCSVIAKSFGGGGHAKACGFQTVPEHPSIHL